MDARPAPFDVRYGSDPGPWVVAHRGGAGLALENTLEAFARSTALGVRYLETDVRATADGVCVAFHDAGLARLARVPGRLADLTWSQARRLRLPGDGRVSRLEEVLEAFPEARVMVDLKERRAIPALARALRACRAQTRVCLAGTDDDALADAAAVLGPGVATAMGWRSAGRLVAAARLGTRPRGVSCAPFVHVPLRLGRCRCSSSGSSTWRPTSAAGCSSGPSTGRPTCGGCSTPASRGSSPTNRTSPARCWSPGTSGGRPTTSGSAWRRPSSPSASGRVQPCQHPARRRRAPTGA